MVLPPVAGLSCTGPFPSHVSSGVDFSWLVGLVVSGVVYRALSRSLDRASEQAAIEVSDRELKELAG
jgi:nucleobase:cation symporter-1, NCS1 family